jgi:hypothetical protein
MVNNSYVNSVVFIDYLTTRSVKHASVGKREERVGYAFGAGAKGAFAVSGSPYAPHVTAEVMTGTKLDIKIVLTVLDSEVYDVARSKREHTSDVCRYINASVGMERYIVTT